MNTRWVKYTAEKVAESMRPIPDGSRWKAPALSRRIAADLRKGALQNGSYGQWVPGQGGWLPEWDSYLKTKIMAPPKLHKHQRNKAERVAKIQKALKEQDKKLEDFRKQLKAAQTKTGLDKWLTKQPWEK